MTADERAHFFRAVVLVCGCTIAVMSVLSIFILRNTHRIEELQRSQAKATFKDGYRSCLQRNQLRAALLLISRREAKEKETPDDLKQLYRTFEEVLTLRDCRPVLAGEPSRAVQNSTQAQVERALRTGECFLEQTSCPIP